MHTLSVVTTLAVLGWLLALSATVAWRPRRRRVAPLPTEWALTARPVFAADERQVYRVLRDALPNHVVLAKLPLVRLCQPTDPAKLHYWFDLLGSSYVSFAICSTNGRVLAAVDLEHERAKSRRVSRIKQSVLAACRVRYLRCPADHLPTAAEVQLLVPQAGNPPRGPQPAPRWRSAPAPSPLSDPAAPARAEGNDPLWRDSSFFHDSFFGVESRSDAAPDTQARDTAQPNDNDNENGDPPFDHNER